MSDMVNSPDALGDDPCTVTGIRAIDEPEGGLVELEITVGCSTTSPRKERPGEHPWFNQFRLRIRLIWGQGQMAISPDGWIRIDVPRGQLEDFIRAVRQAAQALLARQREQAQREAQADTAKRARLAEDQARIDTVTGRDRALANAAAPLPVSGQHAIERVPEMPPNRHQQPTVGASSNL
jgi:hypothetical protein